MNVMGHMDKSMKHTESEHQQFLVNLPASPIIRGGVAQWVACLTRGLELHLTVIVCW